METSNQPLSPRTAVLIAVCMAVAFLAFGAFLLGVEERAAGWIMLVIGVFTAVISLGMLTQQAKR